MRCRTCKSLIHGRNNTYCDAGCQEKAERRKACVSCGKITAVKDWSRGPFGSKAEHMCMSCVDAATIARRSQFNSRCRWCNSVIHTHRDLAFCDGMCQRHFQAAERAEKQHTCAWCGTTLFDGPTAIRINYPDACINCQGIARYAEKEPNYGDRLTGGRWVRDGFIQRWVSDSA